MEDKLLKILEETNQNKIDAETALEQVFDLFIASKSALDVIEYIENDAEIAIPIERFFDALGSHITKKRVWENIT